MANRARRHQRSDPVDEWWCSKWFTGSIDKLVFHRFHNGKVSVYPTPDMSTVKWSQARRIIASG